MVLSKDAKYRLEVAIADRRAAKEISDAIEAGSNPQAATVANIATADATDLPSAIALANANKAKINEILNALKAAGLMA